MAHGVAAEGITREQYDICSQHQRAQSDTERHLACCGVFKPEGFPDVKGETGDEEDRDIQKIPVNVLHDQREGVLPEIVLAWLAYRARRRISPKRFVIGAAIVIT